MISAFQNLSKFEDRTNFGKAGNPTNSILSSFYSVVFILVKWNYNFSFLNKPNN